MDEIRALFDYQRFARTPRLQEQIDSVQRRYFGEALSDDELDVAAAGAPRPEDKKEAPWAGKRIW